MDSRWPCGSLTQYPEPEMYLSSQFTVQSLIAKQRNLESENIDLEKELKSQQKVFGKIMNRFDKEISSLKYALYRLEKIIDDTQSSIQLSNSFTGNKQYEPIEESFEDSVDIETERYIVEKLEENSKNSILEIIQKSQNLKFRLSDTMIKFTKQQEKLKKIKLQNKRLTSLIEEKEKSIERFEEMQVEKELETKKRTKVNNGLGTEERNKFEKLLEKQEIKCEKQREAYEEKIRSLVEKLNSKNVKKGVFEETINIKESRIRELEKELAKIKLKGDLQRIEIESLNKLNLKEQGKERNNGKNHEEDDESDLNSKLKHIVMENNWTLTQNLNTAIVFYI